jgi:hypothetical protein
MFYECSQHGRLEKEKCKIERHGIVISVTCQDCGQSAEQKFIIVCKKHGELTESETKAAKKGHGRCRLCHRESANKRRNNNRTEFNAKMANDRKLNPEKWDKIYKKQYQDKRENQGDLLSLIKVCSKRRITLEQYGKLLESQSSKCGICDREETCKDPKHDRVRRLSIDHCHATGKVRGLLCHSCNTAIGKLKDDVQLLCKAIEYITKHH